ncbi:MAG: guanylate kinase [Bacteroidaceae bacterium]|nr:guanylate kinase [Bacteroidaceae bacterium]
MQGKLIIFCAPSGTGKTTITHWLTERHPELRLLTSISATSREPRGDEKEGVHYFFKTPEEFRGLIAEDAFIEYNEVYHDTFYGTLRSQVDAHLAEGTNMLFDVDVEGGERIREAYGSQALSVFIMPPSIDALRQRLMNRKTDSPEKIEERIARARYEISEAPKFDHRVVNDDLDVCKQEILNIVKDFLS